MSKRELIGTSTAISIINRTINKICNLPNPILITGEAGTGKNLTASIIHEKSKRNAAKLIKFDTLGVPKSHIESKLLGSLEADGTLINGILSNADGGTLLINNIDFLPPDVQSNLMSIILDNEFYRLGNVEPISLDVRLICTAEKNLNELADEGKIRLNLLNELSQFHIHIPPLRERLEDIPELINRFVENTSQELSIPKPVVSTEFLERIMTSDLPGNSSQLKNIIKTSLVMSENEVLDIDNLPDSILSTKPDYIKSLMSELKAVTSRKYKKFLNNIEEELVVAALTDMKYNQVKVAQLLGIDESTLRRKMDKYGIPKKRSRSKLA